MGIFDPATFGGGGGGGGAVDKVSNSDGSLTISPTTGDVVASLNTANPNTWTANQTFGNTYTYTLYYGSSSAGTGIGASEYDLQISSTLGNIEFFINGGLNFFIGSNYVQYFVSTTLNSGLKLTLQSATSTSTSTTNNSSVEIFEGSYWNGTASVNYGSQLYWVQDSTTPSGHLSFNLYNNGTVTQVASLDQSGNLTTNGYVNINAPQTTLSGTTSGSVVWSEPIQGTSYKKFVAYFNAYENTSATAQTITFPTAFSFTPIIIGNNTGTTPSATTTTLTLPVSMSATASGFIIIEGY